MAEQEVRELVQTLEGAEITNEVIEWIREVCKPEALLIDSMSKEFMNNLEKDPAYCNSILKALLLLHDGAEDIVSPQFKVNDTFIPAVIKYLVQTEVESLEGTSYILFTRLFDNNSHAQYVDNELLKRLFDSLSFIKSEKVIKDVVWILLRLSAMTESVSQNPVLEILESHPNHRFFAETLAQIANKCNPKVDGPVYAFIRDYYSFTETPLFYKNDLYVMIDVLLEQVIEIVSVKGQGLLVLESLEALVNTPDYQKEKYKAQDFIELFKKFKSMGSLGTIRKDNFDKFKAVCSKIDETQIN